ncbi:MAG: DUF5069 domain-containing protein [Nibricoccus sp.]
MTKTPARRPTDRLADCLWLARLVEKVRLHLAGELDKDFQMPFGNRRATDGIFLEHFGLTKDEIIEAVRAAGEDDEQVATWFLQRVQEANEKIARWNKIAFQLGRPGLPGERVLSWAKKNLYKNGDDPRVDSIFRMIAADEGYLEQMIAAEEAANSSAALK